MARDTTTVTVGDRGPEDTFERLHDIRRALRRSRGESVSMDEVVSYILDTGESYEEILARLEGNQECRNREEAAPA